MSPSIYKLSKEIQLDFQRSMNKIMFDKIVQCKPEKFPFVEIEEREKEVIPETGKNTIKKKN